MRFPVVVAALILVSSAGATSRQAPGYVCELKNPEGSPTLDHTLKTRKACKKSGGRWIYSQTAPSLRLTSTSTSTSTSTRIAP